MPIRNVPYWLDRFPKSRRPSYPRLHGNLETTVAIVGGGLTGCACAWSFAAAGVKVVLLEADAIGGGATARGPGLVREDFDASFQETSALHGLRSARTLWQAMRRASLDFPAAIRRLEVKCDLAPADLLIFARRDADAARQLQREYQGRRDGGAGTQLGDAGRAGARDGPRGRRGDPDPRRRARSVSRVRGVCRGRRRPRRRALRQVSRPPDPRRTEAGRDHDCRGHRPRRHGADCDRRLRSPTCGRCGVISRPGTATRSSPNRCRRRSVATSAAGRRPCATASAAALPSLDARRPCHVFRGRPARSRAPRDATRRSSSGPGS